MTVLFGIFGCVVTPIILEIGGSLLFYLKYFVNPIKIRVLKQKEGVILDTT